VGSTAPTTRELLPLIEAAGSVADHGSLRPWRIIALRGSARDKVGRAMADAAGLTGSAAETLAANRIHQLAPNERLLGWLYVGAKPASKSGRRTPIKAKDYLTAL